MNESVNEKDRDERSERIICNDPEGPPADQSHPRVRVRVRLRDRAREREEERLPHSSPRIGRCV